jgi:hypothetical protein
VKDRAKQSVSSWYQSQVDHDAIVDDKVRSEIASSKAVFRASVSSRRLHLQDIVLLFHHGAIAELVVVRLVQSRGLVSIKLPRSRLR